jgi:hypothetical protein
MPLPEAARPNPSHLESLLNEVVRMRSQLDSMIMQIKQVIEPVSEPASSAQGSRQQERDRKKALILKTLPGKNKRVTK